MLELTAGAYADDRLLVVDDNPTNVLFLERALAKAGYRGVRSTTRPEEAARLAREERIDLAIIDLHMPGMSGYELLADLRAHVGARLPVLVFTADATGPARRRALEMGANDFLSKPGDPHEIALRVRNFLETAALHRQLADQNARLEERVREAQREIVDRLARVGDYRDDETGDHSRRVGEMARAIALALGLDSAEAETLRLAAPLHDLGKVAVPDAVLKKPGRLTDEEYARMREHARIGADILADGGSDVLRLAHVVALSHHERWDGAGYPQGLRGAAIPLAGRIVAVADVFDALTSERPYKRAWTAEAASGEIARGAGTQFDPAVVAAFLRVTRAAPEPAWELRRAA